MRWGGVGGGDIQYSCNFSLILIAVKIDLFGIQYLYAISKERASLVQLQPSTLGWS